MFYKVIEAYENGDLSTLNLIYDDEYDFIEEDSIGNNYENLKNHIALLNIRIDLIDKDISKIKSSYPYNKKELLKDNLKVSKLRLDLENKIKEFDKSLKEYNEKLENLERNFHEQKGNS
ncbi:MAG: hypothetical protein KO202_04975 [Methanobacteriaceae archaeon]|nr:hypothetical protein [Methanobacteriaceae archaeon]